MAKSKCPTDINQRAKSIVDIATGESKDPILNSDGKNAVAVALGKLGGKKGGKARAESLTAEERSDMAKKAANARWEKS